MLWIIAANAVGPRGSSRSAVANPYYSPYQPAGCHYEYTINVPAPCLLAGPRFRP